MTEPDVTEPDAIEPDAIEPDVTEPDVTEPDVTEPDVTVPGQAPVAPPQESMPKEKAYLFAVAAMLTIVLSVVDQHIVSTVSWPILRDLTHGDGLGLMPWLLSGYVLAATAAMPVYGALSDNVDLRKLYLFAVWAFLVGSALCGAAQNLPQLVAFRMLQGVGGGGMVSVALVILARILPPRARAGGGYGGGLVAFGIVLGPLVGGLVSDHLSWRWVFWGNLPIGLLAVLIAAGSLDLPSVRRGYRVDIIGAPLVVVGTLSALVAVQWGGHRYPWTSAPVLGLLGAGAVLVILFAVRQTRTAAPVIPPDLFRHRAFRLLAPLHVLAGFSLMAAPAYVGTWLQVVRGVDATKAGLTLALMAIGTLAAQAVGGRLAARTGRFGAVLLASCTSGTAALVLLAGVSAHMPGWQIGLALVLLGGGIGGVLQMALLIVQEQLPQERTGSATVACRFAAALGQVAGAVVLGAAAGDTHGPLGGFGLAFAIAAAGMTLGVGLVLPLVRHRITGPA